MDMSGMSMTMSTASATATAAKATSTAKMSMSGGSSCKISMLWNWYTIDSCFIARSWHVRSAGAFAGSCIGVILLVVSLKLLRRVQRDFDRYLRRINCSGAPSRTTATEEVTGSSASSGQSAKNQSVVGALTCRRGLAEGQPAGKIGPLKWWQHLLRSLLFMVQFAVGYFVMLLAMYYNGYIIICIFIGAFIGAALFQWDTYYTKGAEGPEMRDSCCN